MRGANRSSWSGLEGLCVVLRRLAYPNRRFDLESIFGCGEAELSVIFNTTLGFLYNEWNGLITDIARQKQGWLSAERIAESCAAVRRVCPLDHVWGFIDGTAIPIARPKLHQRLWYSGHKRRHVMKFQVSQSTVWARFW